MPAASVCPSANPHIMQIYCGHVSPSIPRLCLVFALDAQFPAGLDSLEDALAVLIELKLGDDDLAGMNAEGNALAIDFLAADALNVDGVLEAIHGRHLALAVLVSTTNDLDFVVFSDGDAADLEAVTSSARRVKGLKQRIALHCTSRATLCSGERS